MGINSKTGRYRHVVWDWNGTLLDDAWLCVQILNGMLGRRGRAAVTHRDYEESFDFPVKEYYARLGFDFAVQPFEQLAVEFVDEYDRRRFDCRLQAGAMGVLGALARQGVTQSVLSAYHQRRLVEIVAYFKLDAFFSRLVGLDDHYACSKIDNGRCLMRDLGGAADEVLLIGDTVHDYETARAMGVACVLVPSGHHPRAKLAACGVPVAESLGELLPLLGGRIG